MSKIILYDIETSPLLVTSWQLRKPYLSHENIERDANILTAAWKELDLPGVAALCVDPTNPTSDAALLSDLRDALEDADVLIGHNSDRFDLPWINTRLVFHGLPPLPQIKTVDTLKIARSRFRFSSNRLDYLGQYLGVGRKIKTEYDLWKQVLAGDAQALTKMVRYNKQDVLLLEKVYKRLRPFATTHPNLRLMDASSITKCPRCGVGDLEGRGQRYTQKGVYQRYHCLNRACGAWSHGERIEKTEIA